MKSLHQVLTESLNESKTSLLINEIEGQPLSTIRKWSKDTPSWKSRLDRADKWNSFVKELMSKDPQFFNEHKKNIDTLHLLLVPVYDLVQSGKLDMSSISKLIIYPDGANNSFEILDKSDNGLYSKLRWY